MLAAVALAGLGLALLRKRGGGGMGEVADRTLPAGAPNEVYLIRYRDVVPPALLEDYLKSGQALRHDWRIVPAKPMVGGTLNVGQSYTLQDLFRYRPLATAATAKDAKLLLREAGYQGPLTKGTRLRFVKRAG